MEHLGRINPLRSEYHLNSIVICLRLCSEGAFSLMFVLDDVGVDVCCICVGSMVDGFRMTSLLSSGSGVRVLVLFARVRCTS